MQARSLSAAAPRRTDEGATVTSSVLAALDDLYRKRLGCAGTVALHEPSFSGNEWAYVKECIDTGWVSSVGSFVTRFENDLASICGAENVIAVVNGTAALHLALIGVGVGPNDLVVCPPLTFVATAASIAHCGASPAFVDVDGRLGLSAIALEQFLSSDCEHASGGLRHRATGRRVAAAVAVHIFGHPADMDSLTETCARHGIPLVEDSAEALGSHYHDRPCGSLATVGTFSFNGNKTITTGAGGAVAVRDAALARRIRHIATTARVTNGWEFDHDEIGYNYRLANINAALGCAQLEQLNTFIERKRRLAATIEDALDGIVGIALLQEPPDCRSNYWLNGFLVERAEWREAILTETNARGLQTRPCWRLIADLPPYKDSPQAAAGIAAARDLAARIVNIPSSPSLMRAHVATHVE